MTQILIIDDEELFREDLADLLSEQGYMTLLAQNASEAEAIVKENLPDIILCDLVLPDVRGCEFIEKLKILCPDSLVVVMTAYGNVDVVIEAFRAGASDFVQKPIQIDLLLEQLKKFIEYRQSLLDLRHLRTQIAQKGSPIQNFKNSHAMGRILKLMQKVAPTESTVLITGENGTGKEIISRGIHDLSPRKKLPFVPVNCCAIPEALFESELFGHTKGSFTGAERTREGLFSVAGSGTIFLDEIAELPLSMQSKLLRVLEERVFLRVGSSKPIPLKARVIAATNRNLKECVQRGEFRKDLYYRLNVFPIHIPPLRKRIDEIPKLCNYFISCFNSELKTKCMGIAPAALRQLQLHDWPGNVRELRNVIERSMILFEGEKIELSDLPEYILEKNAQESEGELLKFAVMEFEKRHILRVYLAANRKKEETARRLGINPSTLYRKSQEYGLEI